MDQGDLDNWVITENLKFDYTFTTLIFATLGLSIQFSPGMGKECPWLLIASWLILLAAGFAGGYRLTKLQYFYKLDARTTAYVRDGNVKGVEKGRQMLNKEQATLKPLLHIRHWGFLAGISANMVFAIVNYLHRIQ
jgi:hypothetical protein